MRKRSEVGADVSRAREVEEIASAIEAAVPPEEIKALKDAVKAYNPGLEAAAKGDKFAAAAYNGKELTVTWGEEKFSPIPNSYSTVTVGSFSLTLSVQEGSVKEAFERGVRLLAEMAEIERERKVQNFVNKLERIRGRQ